MLQYDEASIDNGQQKEVSVMPLNIYAVWKSLNHNLSLDRHAADVE